MKSKIRLHLTIAVTMFLMGTLCLAPGAMADSVDFTSPAGDIGTSHTYAIPGTSLTITASGFCSGTCDHGSDLFGNALGGDDNGLGLASDPSGQNEIFFAPGTTAFIQIDVGNLLANSVTTAQFSMSSISAGESWALFGCPTSLTLCANELSTGTDESIHNLSGLSSSTQFLDFVANGVNGAGPGNVLLNSFGGPDARTRTEFSRPHGAWGRVGVCAAEAKFSGPSTGDVNDSCARLPSSGVEAVADSPDE